MSTSRKLRVKLAKHRHSAIKAARKQPEPEPAESSTAETANLFDFATGCPAKNYLHDSVCSRAHFRAYARPVGHTETKDAWNVSEPPA